MSVNTTAGQLRTAPRPSGVFVIGSGDCARRVIENLTRSGIRATGSINGGASETQRQDPSGQDLCPSVDVVACKGFAGEFELSLVQSHERAVQCVSALVIAEDDIRRANFDDYGLVPGQRTISLSQLETILEAPTSSLPLSPTDTVAFINGWRKDSHPAVARRMLAACYMLQAQAKAQTFFFVNNLKVSLDGAERLYQQAKAEGAIFIKNTAAIPEVSQAQDGTASISYLDELSNSAFLLTADWVVIDEHHAPSRRLEPLAQMLALSTDDDGFLQSDNVRRISNATNRRGVFVAGGSRGVMSGRQQLDDADRAAARVAAFLNNQDREPMPVVQIDRGRCARCLTCLRLCPHAAVDCGQQVAIKPQACFSCGICVAGCPARAIEMESVDIQGRLVRILDNTGGGRPDTEPEPRIVVFGCSRSARQALDHSEAMGLAMPPGAELVQVPCGGTVSSRDLLEAFDKGADGVMLCTCHTGNCMSESGNLIARKRGAYVRDVLQSAGIEADRLGISSIAANMGIEFNRMVKAFTDQIRSMTEREA